MRIYAKWYDVYLSGKLGVIGVCEKYLVITGLVIRDLVINTTDNFPHLQEIRPQFLDVVELSLDIRF